MLHETGALLRSYFSTPLLSTPFANILHAVLFSLLMKRIARWKCEHAKACVSNGACRKKRQRDREAAAAATAATASELEEELAVTPLAAAAFVALALGVAVAISLRERPAAIITPVKPGETGKGEKDQKNTHIIHRPAIQ